MAVAPHVAICIATFKRPEGLQKLLDGIRSLAWDGTITVLVVDNDPEKQEGIEIAQDFAQDSPWEVVTRVESESGIPFPRNAAIAAGLQLGADLFAFIDDDEVPGPGWLRALYSGIELGADLSGGPQVPVFPLEATDQQRSTSYYGHDQDVEEGATCQLESSGNFMVTAEALRPHGPPWFDPRYARTSGADHDLFRRLEQAGAQMRWVPKAAVAEDVPIHRLNDQWLRDRVVEIHNGRVRIDSEYRSDLQSRAVRLLKTVALGLSAAALTLVGTVNVGRSHDAKLLRWKFLGKMQAHLGQVTDRVEDRPGN